MDGRTRRCRSAIIGLLGMCLWTMAQSAAAASAPGQPAGSPALPRAPYTMKCFLDRDLVVNEDLAGKPTFKDGQWQAKSWSLDPKSAGLDVVIQQGANATCIVKQNEK
jgi:hypothetical protein